MKSKVGLSICVLCPLFCGVACILWWRSLGYADTLALADGPKQWTIVSANGSLFLTMTTDPARSQVERPWIHSVRMEQEPDPYRDIISREEFAPPEWSRMGFGLRWGHRISYWNPPQQISFDSYDVVVPIWFVACLTPLPVYWPIRYSRRHRHRVKNGLCLNCGYDLRGTNDRCPECGHGRGPIAGKQTAQL